MAEDVQSKETIVKEIEDSVKSSGGKKQKKLSYEATVTLPSRGLLYGDEIPAEITLRGMTTKEEKILYASQGGDVFKKILKNCITNPKNLDVNKLVASDESFLIMQLRMVTFGDKYKVSVMCPHCNKRDEYTINLSDFTLTYLDENFKEPIVVELPRSGDTVYLRLLRNEDNEFVERYSRRFAKQHNLDYREVLYTSRMAKYITKIDDDEIEDFLDAREYVDNMASLDSAKFWTAIRKVNFGLDTTATVTCRSCGQDFDFSMPLTSEFFRPSIE